MKQVLRSLSTRERFFSVTFTRFLGAMCFGAAGATLAFAPSRVDVAVPFVTLTALCFSYASRWEELYDRAQLAQDTALMAYMAMYASGRALVGLVREGRYEHAASVADQQAHVAEVFLAEVGGNNGDG